MQELQAGGNFVPVDDRTGSAVSRSPGSGAAYAYYLAEDPEERQRVSDADPLLDALGAADYDSARTIARWSVIGGSRPRSTKKTFFSPNSS